MIPLLAELARLKVDGSVFSFVWFAKDKPQPLALWVDPMNEAAYRGFMHHHAQILAELPLREMQETGGRIIRATEHLPAYETTAVYREIFIPYGIHWGMSVPVLMSGSSTGIMNICRPRLSGPYSDADWDLWERVGKTFVDLDRSSSPLANLPAAPFRRDAQTTTLWLAADGQFLAQSALSRKLLFLAEPPDLGNLVWMLPDKRALPEKVRLIADRLFAANTPYERAELSETCHWGRFDYTLEKMPTARCSGEYFISIAIHYHEPLDKAVARGLWGWPLSPQEKRILIASARHPSHAELSEALGLTIGTLKNYINSLLARLGMASREEVIDRALSGERHTTLPSPP